MAGEIYKELVKYLEGKGYKVLKKEDFHYLKAFYLWKEVGFCSYLVVVKKYSSSTTVAIIGKYPNDVFYVVRLELTNNNKINVERGWINSEIGEDLINYDEEYNLIVGFLLERDFDISKVDYMNDWFIEFYLKEFAEFFEEKIDINNVDRVIVEIE